ncbi:ExeM/NucH family extracellular endonuclease [Rhodovulum euryhalinum]|uniref:Putative extracellular nuclease n=1 Tax=Rhodovulum euryhalinum TaxID=35805 RepID=A0A4R2KSY0_9RHOB|nr:ExeM/NucH family extracellular endonuclease [Rhodovulum euryhalinum]TCO74149.1 putative extracellular nuclease [Rhodovulum euryhalinum]
MTYDEESHPERNQTAEAGAGIDIAPELGAFAEGAAMAESAVFTLELLHAADQEAGAAAILDAPRFSAVLNALKAQDLGSDGVEDNTIVLSSGDAFIPGLFYDASAGAFGTAGIADIQIQNELGFQAIAFGNHEFDFNTTSLAALIAGTATGDFSALVGTALEGLDFGGTDMPYLSTNLDFSTDANLAPLEIAGGQAPQGNSVTSSTVIDVNGELIGVVGATTPTLASISSPGGVTISPGWAGTNPTPAELDALAAIIQAEVDALLAANPAMNKVILLAHMQQIGIEMELAGRLANVDIIVAGGSNTRLFDETDRVRDGDSVQGGYPEFVTNAGGSVTAVVNTDGSYKYVGRLVLDFDADGNVIAESYDSSISGAYATDAQGVADLGAAGLVDPEIQAIADAIEAQILATEGNVFGASDVFLNGNRSGADTATNPDGVRTQETNLGNLTADANLAAAQEIDSTVVVSIKNGGGIRASIGQTIVPPGGSAPVRLPNEAVVDSDGNLIKPAGGISQNDIQTSLAFNNGLVLLTLTKAELVGLLEHGVSAIPAAAGAFPQIGGLRLSYDPDLPAGDRVLEAGIFTEAGDLIAELVRSGEIAGDPAEEFRVVTLDFLSAPRFDAAGAFIGAGDGYPFPNTNTDPTVGEVGDADVIARVNKVFLAEDGVQTGEATFANDGTEQDALAEYLKDNYEDTPFAEGETGRDGDTRIQNLNFRDDAVFEGFDLDAPEATGELGDIGIAAVFDSGAGEGGSEVVATEDGKAYVTNGALGRIDVWDIASGSLSASIDLTYLPGFAGVQSVAVKNGLIAAAVSSTDIVSGADVLGQSGYVALIDGATGLVIDRVVTGNLPDMVTFSPDGTKILVANEGEFNAESDITVDPVGSVSIIDVSNLVNPTVQTLTFGSLAAVEGVRLAPGASYLEGLEPEYIAVTDDGTTAYVSLQEANAFAKIDLATGAIDLIPLGTVDHSQEGSGLDANDDGLISIRTYDNLVGLRMPDAIDAFEVDGATYIITANEGDGRGDGDEGGDEARVGDILDGDIPGLAIDASVDTTGLERLVISTIDGDTDGDGDIDVLHAFGSRSFTIFDADGNVVFDSGSEFERILSEVAPERFNNDDGEPIATEDDNRSDAKGPEPEAVVTGEVNGALYAFIGLERDSGIVIYNISEPTAAYFVDYIPGFGNDLGAGIDDFIGPETIAFIPAAESLSGVAQIVAAYEISGDTVVYDLGDFIAPPTPILIAEFQPNPDGTDPVTQTVELSGAAGAMFDLWLVSVENDGVDGRVDRAENVTGSFDANGIATVEVADLENPSFTFILTDAFTGAAAVTDIDTDNDGVVDDLSAFGTILDAIGSADSAADFADSYADDAALGGVAFAYTGTEPELMFRDASRGDWYAVNAPGDAVVYAADGSTVDPAEFDTDPTVGTDSFGAVNPSRAGGTADLQITELWFGQDGTDLTADWIEVTNTGTAAWTAATDGALFYDDESLDPTVADQVQGVDSLAPGESAIIVIGQAADAAAFAAVWGDDADLSDVQIGWADGAGLGAGGDAAGLFLDAEGDGLALTDTPIATASYPDGGAAASGRSYDVPSASFSSLAGFEDMSATTELGGTDGTEPAIASPGYIPTERTAPDYTLISTIQGAGFSSGLVGQTVTVQAVVTVVSDALNGFFLQEEDGDADGDAATSEGVFVYTGSDPSVQVGDLVTLEAIVDEYFQNTQLKTIQSLVVEAQGVELPTSVTVSLPLPGGTDPATFYESVEGMRVTVVAADGEVLSVTDTFTRFGEVGVTSGAPLVQPTQAFESFSAEAEALAEANTRDFLLFENAEDDSLSSAPRVGDGIVGNRIDGVMHFTFDEYKVETQGAVAFDTSVNPFPRTDAPEDIEGRLKVASFNVLNYFTTLTSEDSAARGAATADQLADQTSKIVAAIKAIDADIVGLIEIENDLSAPDEAVAALVAALNAEMGAGTYDYIATGKIGTDAIKQAIIFKPATVAPKGDFAVLDTVEFTDPLASGGPLSRPAVAQSFTEVATGEVFTVSVNHLKSKGSASGVAGDDSDVEGSAALTRVEAVKELAEWLATDPTGSGDADHLTIGDFNSYAMERAIRAIEDAGFTNLADADATSYQFDGRLGTLDYAFANESLAGQVAGATIWNVNSLEAYAQQYSDARFDALGDPASPFGSSDHDPVIVGLNLETEVERNLIVSEGDRDRLTGTEEADIFEIGSFRSEMATGLGGADIFLFDAAAFEDGTRGLVQIRDYMAGEDMVDLGGGSFDAALVSETANAVYLTMDGDGDRIVIRGIDSLDDITFVDHLDMIA